VDGDEGVGALFVGVGVAFVFVEGEVGVGSGVDAEFYGGVRVFSCVLDLGA
jgi:hypothetical protein